MHSAWRTAVDLRVPWLYCRSSMTSEYRALVAKVASFTDAVAARRSGDLACTEGCASCCLTWLTVSPVEAEEVRGELARLDPETRENVRLRGRRELAREAADEGDPRCAMLDEQGRCVVYASRPLVCRTQGHALRYPAGLIPTGAVTRKTANGDVTWCPLNYNGAGPGGEDVLDAERVNQILAVVAQRHAALRGVSRVERLALSALAAEGDVLHDQTARDYELSPECRDRDDRSERQDPACSHPTRGR